MENSPKNELKDSLLDVTTNDQLSEDTTCGIWFIKGPFLQKLANKKTFVVLYGLLGCVYLACYAYFNGTITTVEKRFKIPSRNTGIITVGNDITTLCVSAILSYYAGRGHRPRWMALGLYTVVLFCLLTALPHFLYGAGTDALSLTKEYGANMNNNISLGALEANYEKTLCHIRNTTSTECETETSNYIPQVIFFTAQLISGVGGSLYYTLGVSYIDDNIKKSKTPALISFSFTLRMLGPALGYGLASICLKLYVSPNSTPTINNNDPRWLGAWWLGWIILSLFLFVLASLFALFPKTLPRAAARKELLRKQGSAITENGKELPTSVSDMIKTFKRLISNKILMLNNFASVFYFFGYTPYWIFLPKYLETQYRQSASASNLITGTTMLIFSAIGLLVSGVVISKLKPRARSLAGWNVIVGAISVAGIISYAYLGCIEIDDRLSVLPSGELNPNMECNKGCSCDYVKYNPVCSENGNDSFISACHAGCKRQKLVNGTKMFFDCSCIKTNNKVHLNGLLGLSHEFQQNETLNEVPLSITSGIAISGNCKVDCYAKFYTFLAVLCLLKFTGAAGRASNFLVTVRCVDEKDKPVALGFGLTLMSLFAFLPSPIFFGIILDNSCLVWGRTCTGNGNCWLYNGETLRYTLNFTAGTFVLIGTLLDVGVWYLVKGLKIFDEEVEMELDDLNS